MVLCDTCKHLGNMASWPCEDCLQGDRYERKPMTNADKYFRNATDEELAEYLSERSTAPSCTGKCHKDYEVYGELRTFCHDCWLDWLKQKVKSDG